MLPPVPYKGEKPYIFISYAHKDADRVWPIVARLQLDGYRVWYDEGIDPGTEWDENIASHVKNCGYFLAFLSKSYLQSDNCKDELNFARDLEKKQVLVYLEDVELPQGMALRFGRFQNFRADRPGFFGRLYEAEGIQAFTTGKKTRSKKWILHACLAAAAVIAAALVLPGLLKKEPAPEPPATEPATTQPTEAPFTLKQATILSTSGVKLSARDFYFHENGDLYMDVQLENTSQKEVHISFNGIYLNGHPCKAGLQVNGAEDYTHYIYGVEPNVNIPAQLVWQAEELKASGLGDIQDVKDITCIEGLCQLEPEGEVTNQVQVLYYPYGQEKHVPLSYTPDADDLILVDRQDYQLIFTDHFVDEDGCWIGTFLHRNLSDRHISASLSVDQTNGYVNGDHNVAYIRPESMVYSQTRLEEWKATQCDAVRRLDGWYWLYDTDAQEWINERTDFTIFPEADTDITFPLRTLDKDDTVLLENEYIRMALVEEFSESEDCYTWQVYCVNLSDRTVRVELVDTVENGRDWYDWYIGTLEPGQQCVATENYYHEEKTNESVLSGDLVVREDGYDGRELTREPLRLEFHW